MSLTREFEAGKLNVKIYSNREEMGKRRRVTRRRPNALLSEKSEITIIRRGAVSERAFCGACRR